MYLTYAARKVCYSKEFIASIFSFSWYRTNVGTGSDACVASVTRLGYFSKFLVVIFSFKSSPNILLLLSYFETLFN